MAKKMKKDEKSFYCGIDCKRFDALNPFPIGNEPKGWCTPEGTNGTIPCNPNEVCNEKACFLPK